MVGRLFLSFWDICLENLPLGTFEHRAISAPEAREVIQSSRATKTPQCVTSDDLLAPYRQRERRRHQALCDLLRRNYDLPLDLDDFLITLDEEPAVQSIAPLQLAELQPGQRLLIVSCDYQLADGGKEKADPEDWFVLAQDCRSLAAPNTCHAAPGRGASGLCWWRHCHLPRDRTDPDQCPHTRIQPQHRVRPQYISTAAYDPCRYAEVHGDVCRNTH